MWLTPNTMVRAKLTPWTVYLLSIISLGVGLQQTFRVTPQSVQVVAGSDVTLHCEVDNQRGSVQWTKDGFALGFNRSIPGFQRYVVLGEEAAGVHNLRITNVTLQDDGDYQCQVTPYRDARAIRHAANLTVLLPPASIQMVGHVVEAPVTVTAGEPLRLECLIKDSKPVSQVVWYRASKPLRLKSQVDSREGSTSGPHLSTLRTKITFTPTHSDNGVEYSCHALHPALLPQHTPLVGRVRLDVHYEPGAPQVTGYRAGEVLRTGDRRTLTCRAWGGNPPPEVAWYKDGQLVDQDYDERGNFSVNTYELHVAASDNLATYQCRVTNDVTSEAKTAEVQPRVHFAPSVVAISGPSEARVGEVISLTCVAERSNPAAEVNLVMNSQTPRGARSRTEALGEGAGWTTITSLHTYTVQPALHHLTVNCYAHNPALGSTKVHTKVISVLRPPEPPVILGYEPGRLLTQGEPHRLRCVSGGGNPLARLQWYRGGQPLPTHATQDANSTSAELDLQPVASDNGAEYRCEAKNSATVEPLVASVVLSVLFPPSEVKVWAEPRVARAESQVTLLCESGSSNPQAKLTWWRAGTLLQPGDLQVTPGQFGGTTARYSAQVGVTREEDGAVFTCHAHNHLGVTIRENLTLSVHYPPIWLQEPAALVDVTEEEDVLVEVDARGNPPDVTYLWLHLPEKEVMRGPVLNLTEGQEVMRGPVLNLTEVTRGQAGLYTVLASNSEGNTSRNVTVRVKYAASITSITGVQTVALGERAALRCVARARPRPHLTWRRTGYDFTRTHITQLPHQEGLQLTIRNATMADMGAFTCVAKNEVGEAASVNTTLLISHQPTIDQSVGRHRTSAEVGGTARLVCRASGAPTVRFRWYTHRHTLIHPPAYTRPHQRYILQEPKVVDGLATHESVLLVKNVSAEDYGDFECRAENGLGSSRVFLRLVAPTRPDAPRHLQVTNTTHNSVQLAWTPAYDGGLQQKFRIRFRAATTSRYHYRDVHPANGTRFTVGGLAPATTYHLQAVAYNPRGQSSYSRAAVLATTSTSRLAGSPPTRTHVSGLIVVLTTLVSVALLVLNVTLITCFIKRRARKRLPASLDKGSSKGVSRGLLPPTVGGPAHTPMTEKGGCEDSAGRQECQASCVRVATTCLVHPLDPPPQYAHSPPPSAILPPQYAHSPPKTALLPQSHTNLTTEFCDGGRHILHNAAMEPEARYGDQAWQTSAPPEQYEITSLDSVYPLPTRHTAHHPPTHALPTSHAQSNGPLRRNTPFRLHIPKDYIRSGYRNLSASSSVCGLRGVHSTMPHAHVHALPLTSTPLLSALALGARQPPTEVPLEQRGHLV